MTSLKPMISTKCNSFVCFFSVVTFRSVQAYDNSISSLELICKSEFDPYQL